MRHTTLICPSSLVRSWARNRSPRRSRAHGPLRQSGRIDCQCARRDEARSSVGGGCLTVRMFGKHVLEGLSEAEVLDYADACAETARQAEVELLRVAYQFAVLNDPDRIDPDEAAKPGREKARRFGGEGVAEVAEFAAASLGARIGRTTYAAGQLIADAQDLRHRHPVLWGRVQAGEVRSSYARHVCARTRDLSPAEAAHVDAEVAESADGRLPWTRFEDLVEGKVAVAAPEAARAKEERARQARFAKRLRGEEHGMASFMIRADVGTIKKIDDVVTSLADRLTGLLPDDPAGREEIPDTDHPNETYLSVDDRRVRAVMLLMLGHDPDSELDDLDVDPADLVPATTLVVHISGDAPETDEQGEPQARVARVEDHGPVTEDWVRAVLGPHARFTIRPVFDPLGQTPVDAYEVPERHRRAVRLMTPADCFPYGSSLDANQEVDHTVPYDPGGPPGQSRIGNYGPLTRTHHRIKTHGRWHVEQPFPGIYVWRDPHGGHYLVDHTGTRRTAPTPNLTTEPRPPVVVEIYRGGPIIELSSEFDAA